MFKFLRRHRTLLLTTLAVVILGLPFFGIGGNFLLSSPQDTIIKVNGEKIKLGEYNRLYNQIARQRGELTADQRKQLPREVLNELIRQNVFSQEAHRYGVHVPDLLVRMELQAQPAFQTEGKFDPGKYGQFLNQVARTPAADFEKSQKKDIAARQLNQIIASAVHVSDERLQAELEKRLAEEKDPKKRKELTSNREALRRELRDEEINQVFQDWLAQLNAGLRVDPVSEEFQKRLSGAS